MWEIVFTDVAENDLLRASEYIAEILKAPAAAENLIIETEKAIGNLANFPLWCPLVSDEYFSERGVRFLRVKNYLAFYVVDEMKQVVSIIRFLYARRDWISLLGQENED